MRVSKSPKQRLPSGPQALIQWAEEHHYGPVTTYTSTPVANHFNVWLKPQGNKLDPGLIRLKCIQYIHLSCIER